MFNRSKLCASIACSALLFAAPFNQSVLAQDDLPETEVNVVGSWGNLAVYQEREKPFWTETIPEESGGAVTANLRPFTEMGMSGEEVFSLLRQGVLEFATSAIGYVAGTDPRTEGTDLAGLTEDLDQIREANEAFRPYLNERFEEQYGLKLLAFFPNHDLAMACNTPINGIDDLEGKKIRVHSRSLAEFVEAAGATSSSIPFPDVVPALERGVIDCAVSAVLGLYNAKWYEVTSHLYTLPLGWSMLFHAANLEAWNALPENVQAFLEDELQAWEERNWEWAQTDTEDGVACLTGGNCPYGEPASLTLVEVSDEDRKRIHEIRDEVIVPSWAGRCGEECTTSWNETVGNVLNTSASIEE